MADLTKIKIPRPLLYLLAVLVVLGVVGGGYLYLKSRAPSEPPVEDKYVVDLMDVSYPKGAVRKVSSSKITIQANGGTKSYVIDNDTEVEFEAESLQDIIDQKNKASLSDIKVGDQVSITVVERDNGQKWAGNIVILKD
jgi:Cu/Ag efflux protein CusF